MLSLISSQKSLAKAPPATWKLCLSMHGDASFIVIQFIK
jgi:hypothetical protein